MNSKNLLRAGCFIGAAGLIVLAHDFLQMYSLAGDCPDGSVGCKAYSSWHALNLVALALIVIGGSLVIASYMNHKKK